MQNPGLRENPSLSVIVKPPCDPVMNPKQNQDDCYYHSPNQYEAAPTVNHSIKATKAADSEKIRGWLNSQTWKGTTGSPLADYSEQIAASPYWSLILAICYQEQNHCVSAPSWNFWGMGPGKKYNSPQESIQDINNYLANHESAHPTIESFRHWYCYASYNESHICPEWEPSILNIKAQVEAL